MKIHHKKQANNKKITGSVVKGVAGATAIAGIAVAATMVLQDEKTRKKVKKALTNVKDQAVDYVEKLKTKPVIGEGTQTVKKVVKGAKKALRKSK